MFPGKHTHTHILQSSDQEFNHNVRRFSIRTLSDRLSSGKRTGRFLLHNTWQSVTWTSVTALRKAIMASTLSCRHWPVQLLHFTKFRPELQRNSSTLDLSHSGLWEKKAGGAGHENMYGGPRLGFPNSVRSFVHFFPCFSFRDIKMCQGSKSYLNWLKRSKLQTSPLSLQKKQILKIHNNPHYLKIVSRHCPWHIS